MPILVMLLVAGAFYAGSRFGRERERRDGVQLLPPGSAPISSISPISSGVIVGGRRDVAQAQPRMPSPNLVLNEVVKLGGFPPPYLIQAALAEAELAGDGARCQYIVTTFMAPVVAAAMGLPAQASQAQAHQAAQVQLSPANDSVAWLEHPSPIGISDGRGYGPYGKGYWCTSNKAGIANCPIGPSGEKLDSSYDWQPDPKTGFMPGLPPISVVPNAQIQAGVVQTPNLETVNMPGTSPIPPEVAQMAASQIEHRPAGASIESPFPSLPRESWLAFASALEGEHPAFASDKHVGRYRHNRRRVRELGIDDNQLAANASQQDSALAADLVDAHQHVSASGMATDFVGQSLDVPSDEGDVSAAVTLSGMLAVCCVAGLDGAADWLTKPSDRRSFPNTTAAFWRANGLF